MVQSLRPIVDAKDRLALVECLADIPIPTSVTVLLDILNETADKTFQNGQEGFTSLESAGTACGEHSATLACDDGGHGDTSAGKMFEQSY